jgi:hypothetical protein
MIVGSKHVRDVAKKHQQLKRIYHMGDKNKNNSFTNVLEYNYKKE